MSTKIVERRPANSIGDADFVSGDILEAEDTLMQYARYVLPLDVARDIEARRNLGRTTVARMVTPDVADDILRHRLYENQRRVRDKWAGVLADSIRTNSFVRTHQPIAFDEDGMLIDGQHRLHAIVRAKKGQVLDVALNVPIDTVFAIDRMAARRIADQLSFEGLKGNNTTVAAAATWILLHDNRRLPWGGAYRMPDKEILDFAMENHADLAALASEAKRSWIGCDVRPPDRVVTAAMYLAERTDPNAARTFFEQARDGIGLSYDSPALKFRAWFTNAKASTGSRETVDVFAYLGKAWLAHLENKTIPRALHWRGRGPAAEPFPYFDGWRPNRVR